jgi:hypothetical protein
VERKVRSAGTLGLDQNETCNTQQFNFLLPAQSASTPLASKVSSAASRKPVDFKVPEIPFKKSEKKRVTVVEEMNEVPDKDDNLSRSIYMQDRVILPEAPEKWEEIGDDFQQSFIEQENCYQHSMVECDFDEKEIREMMDAEGNNPFSIKLRQMMLEKCNFVENLTENCLMLHKIKVSSRRHNRLRQKFKSEFYR